MVKILDDDSRDSGSGTYQILLIFHVVHDDEQESLMSMHVVFLNKVVRLRQLCQLRSEVEVFNQQEINVNTPHPSQMPVPKLLLVASLTPDRDVVNPRQNDVRSKRVRNSITFMYYLGH